MQSYLACTRSKVVNIFVGAGFSSRSKPGTGYKYRSVFPLISLFLASALFPSYLLAQSSASDECLYMASPVRRHLERRARSSTKTILPKETLICNYSISSKAILNRT
jgi:hypothetical protein